jgi:flagellin
MLSVNQTASSYTALSTLKQISKDLQTTQDRIATGLKVSSAADNATVWSTAQNLRSDIKVQDTYKAGMTTAKAKADVAAASLDKILDVLGKMKESVAKAVDQGDGNFATIGASVQKEMTAYKAQLLAIVKGASLDGSNFLTSGAAVDVKIGEDAGSDINLTLASFTKVLDTGTPANASTLGGTAAYTTIFTMKSFSDATATTGTTTANIALADGALDTAISTITSLRDSISGFSSALESQADFMQKMTDIRKSALSDLVDADMSQEAAKVSSLQVKQQLAYQALSIGNNSSQNILRLFQ